MKARFEGADGHRLLIDALKQQVIVQGDGAIAERLAAKGELVEYRPGEVLVEQDGADNPVFFLLVGQVTVFANKRAVAVRKAGETIGEMAAIDASAPRAASVSAKTAVTALKIVEADFNDIGDAHPGMWKRLAAVIGQRLRERNQFQRAPNAKPVMFLGCSAEGLSIAKQLQLLFKHSPVELRLWTSGVFGPGGITVEELLKQVETCDFAAFLFGPDDKLASRGEEYAAPRDNVVFELGLFMGRIGRDRAFIVKEDGSDVKIPTDLLGVTAVTYTLKSGGDVLAALGPVQTELETAVAKLGVR